MATPTPWFGIRKPLSATQQWVARALALLLPLGVWCLVSYCPYVWHPMVKVTDPGGSAFLKRDTAIDKTALAEENARLTEAGKAPAVGVPANPIFLPAPHRVAIAMYTAFKTEPTRRGDLWLHESLWHSIQIIFWGFLYAAAAGIPLGILCGTFSLVSRVTEPFVDFVRYMPAPAFGALAVAVMGINDAPKIAIIFIGTFFQMVLVVANTTRLLDTSLLEAAQVLGAKPRRLLSHVILPGILPNLFNDMRILLGWAWTYLIVAELIGASSGISYFINQQGKYRNYENVYAGIILIGLIGLVTDQILAMIAPRLFPWTRTASVSRVGPALVSFIHGLVNTLGSSRTERIFSRPTSPAATDTASPRGPTGSVPPLNPREADPDVRTA